MKSATKDVNENLPLQVLDEVQNRFYRRNKLVIRGLPEPTTGSLDERKESDKNNLQQIVQYLTDEAVDIKNVTRVAKAKPSAPRMVKFTVKDEESKRSLLRKATSLRKSPNFKEIYIGPDSTPQQQLEDKLLRGELKERRARGESVVIR